MVEFRVLGPLEVSDGHVLHNLPSRRQRALIARLLLSRGRVVSAEALADAIWEDDPPRDARHAVHTYVSRIRGALGSALVTRSPGYMLAVPPESVDAERFDAGVRQAVDSTADDPLAAVTRFDELLAMWRGPAYAEFADTFAQTAAARLDELRLVARENRGEALIRAGSFDRAVAEFSELVGEHPLRERPHGQLMRALYLAGRQSDALDVYSRFRERLRDELGLDPSPSLRGIHDEVLRHAVEAPARAPDRSATRAAATTASPARTMTPKVPVTAPMTRFVGRDEELRALRRLTDESRLVTLVGPGGVGKTRLAQEMAARSSGDDRQTCWVDLVPAREPADVPYRFVDALGLAQPAEGSIDDFLVGVLSSARALIVVDNCEHVIEAAAGIISEIVSHCSDVAAIATSREPLAVPGEQVMIVSPFRASRRMGDGNLDEYPAVALFADRFRASGGPELGPDDLRVVAELCDRLDGLPLAIELAAARARSLGVTTIAARPVLDLLTGVRRGGEARHRSLRAVLDWSHELLNSQEKILFRRLAAFSAPFTLDDTEAVCADGTLPSSRVAESLGGLVDKSMVAGPAQARYRLLETMRVYASERLAEHGEERWVGGAHARHFVELAERAHQGLLTSREKEWANTLATCIDELRTVHRWACAHDADLALRLSAALTHYATSYMRFELHDWAEAAAALPDAQGHPMRAAALGSAAAGAWLRGDFGKAKELAKLGTAVSPPHDPMTAGPWLVLGDVALLEGRFGDAIEAYRAGADRAGTVAPYITCDALGGQALALSHQGDTATALRLADGAMQCADDAGAPGLIAMAWYFAAECRLTHDPATALNLVEQARRLAADVGALFVLGLTTLSSASLRARAGADQEEALGAFGEAIEHWRRVGNRTQQWVTLRNLVPLLVRAGHDRLACMIEGALRKAPVRLPVEVPVPEADALERAVAEARGRLGDAQAAAVTERGARMSLDALLASVLELVPGTPSERSADHAGSSR